MTEIETEDGGEAIVAEPEEEITLEKVNAQARSLLRDRGGPTAPTVIEIADLRIEPANHSVTKGGVPLHAV